MEVPLTMQAVVDCLRRRNPQEAVTLIQTKVKDDRYSLVREELEPVRRTAEMALTVSRLWIQFLEQAANRAITLELVGDRKVTGRVGQVNQNTVGLYEKSEEEGLFALQNIPMRDIAVAYIIQQLKLKPRDNPDLAMALFFEAEAQGDEETRENMRDWAQGHALRAFIEGRQLPTPTPAR